MKLLPSLKQKKRYIAFEILTKKKESFSPIEVEKEALEAVQSFLGQLGIAKAAPLFLKERFDPKKQRFVIKVNHRYVDEIKAALTLIKKIKNTEVIIKSVSTSGTIKKIMKSD